MDKRSKARARRFCAPVALCMGLASCDGDKSAPTPDLSPPAAKMNQVRDFEADLAAKRHPGDGGGSARLLSAPSRVVAGGAGRWSIQYTVGEHGIDPGGVITLMPEPFWGWSTPQAERRDFPGYTEVVLESEGAATFETATFGGAEAGMFLVTVKGAALEPGATLTLDYGAGPEGARADRYAGRGARLWLAVDSDGDGVRALVASSPTVNVEARAPARAVLIGPSVTRPGELARYSISLLDEWANAEPKLASGEPWVTSAALSGWPSEWRGPASIKIGAEGSTSFEVRVGSARAKAVRVIARVSLPDDEVVSVESNPLWVDPLTPRIFWADLHGHSGLSDGTGAARDYFRYARDVARLDVIALTDHDHFGMAFLDARPEWWEHIQTLNTEFNVPGRFVSILGYEWTSWIHGHRHVLYFDGSGGVLSSITRDGHPSYDTPAKLWDALRGQNALTIAHHSSGNPIPINWTFAPDPVLEPVTEVVSVHGSSEAGDAPHVVAGSRPGQFVRDQLERGYQLGFIGSGDSHDGHPGLPHLSPGYGWRPATIRRGELTGTGGLAGIRARGLSREAVYQALRARQTYATSGPRIAIRDSTDDRGHNIQAAGTAPFAKAELILGPPNARVRAMVLPETPSRDVSLMIPADDAKAHRYVYVRLVQVDGGTAWYGPFWTQASAHAPTR